MSIEFIKHINDYVIESTMEMSDEEILLLIGENDYPAWDEIHSIQSMINQVVSEKRKSRLDKNRSEYIAFNKDRAHMLMVASAKMPVQEMLSDIVKAMQNKDKVPEGLLIAFREQGEDGSEEDVRKIWESMVELGLIEASTDGL